MIVVHVNLQAGRGMLITLGREDMLATFTLAAGNNRPTLSSFKKP